MQQPMRGAAAAAAAAAAEKMIRQENYPKVELFKFQRKYVPAAAVN